MVLLYMMPHFSVLFLTSPSSISLLPSSPLSRNMSEYSTPSEYTSSDESSSPEQTPHEFPLDEATLATTMLDGTVWKKFDRPLDPVSILDVSFISDSLKGLTLQVTRNTEAARFLPALIGDISMPQLEELAINVQEDDGNTARDLAFLEFKPAIFPSLHSLLAIGVQVVTYPSLARNLRRLVLVGNTQSPRPDLVMQGLACLEACYELEELRIVNYFGPTDRLSRQRTHTRSTPIELTFLREVHIQEHPLTIGLILSRFIIRPRATILLVGNDNPSSPATPSHQALTEMLSVDGECLPVLRQLTDVDISYLDGNCIITGANTGFDCVYGKITLKLPDALRDSYSQAPNTRHLGDLIRACAVPFFHPSVIRLSITGRFYAVPNDAWTFAFCRLPELSKIRYNDPDVHTIQLSWLEALATHYPREGYILCHRLSFLDIRCGLGGWLVPEQVCDCLERRGSPSSKQWLIIDEIRIHLTPSEPWPPARIAYYRKKLLEGVYAADTFLDVINPQRAPQRRRR
ncbi:hypothetical protein C8Q78DRAFT_675861 [Trametes maxima]|nr:hypothetical protein C8Q78DRAFT_675861 [Trametes maxima]